MIRKIRVEEIEEGMYVSGFEKDGSENVTFTNNILVRSRKDVEHFLKNGYRHAYVFARAEAKDDPAAPGGEPASGTAAATAPGGERKATRPSAEAALPEPVMEDGEVPPASDPVEFKEEIKEAKKVRDEAEEIVREFSRDFRMGNGINSPKVHKTVGKMIGSIFRNRDALTSLVRIKSFDEYVFTHSVNVCILSLIIGRNMGLSRGKLNDIGMGAILHDVGKMLVPAHILNKPGALTPEEFDEVKKHSRLGAEVLGMSKDIKDDSLQIILRHHESYNGKGYPDGLRGEDIHIYARIAAVADIYDAMTSDRIYRKAISPNEVLQKMYMLRFTHYDPEFVERLIKSLGIYPVGTLVGLNTGELAIVRKQDPLHPLKPTILLFFNKDREPYKDPFEVNLTEDHSRCIVASKGPSAFGVALDDFLLEG
ncbi:MAG: HD-GYP domain-containing protein [Deltaproteobacteria bacterium]|nr:HD-GYP domain-containing protein [Deltaproteobacteria bacterium]